VADNWAALLVPTVEKAHEFRALSDADLPTSKVLPRWRPSRSPPGRSLAPSRQAARVTAAGIAGFLFYLSLGVYAGTIANEITQEKTSRTGPDPARSGAADS
jgi:hypothetical protein